MNKCIDLSMYCMLNVFLGNISTKLKNKHVSTIYTYRTISAFSFCHISGCIFHSTATHWWSSSWRSGQTEDSQFIFLWQGEFNGASELSCSVKKAKQCCVHSHLASTTPLRYNTEKLYHPRAQPQIANKPSKYFHYL